MLTTNSLFQEGWWLDAAAPGKWDAVEVEEGGTVVARLPFVLRRNRGISVLTQPGLTPTLGPWVAPLEGASPTKQMAAEKERLAALVERLPPHHVFRQNFTPEATNALPFQWAGFDARVRYTYRLEGLDDLDAVHAGFADTLRRQIRKAQKTVEVGEGELEPFLALQRMTFGRQGLQPPSEQLVRRLDEAAAARGARRILSATDAAGNTHAAIFVVWDERVAYYLMGGRDDAYANSAAMSLLLWEAIRLASGVSRAFDFEGSMIESIERFFRSFGGRRTPYLRVERDLGPAAGLRHARALTRWALRRPAE